MRVRFIGVDGCRDRGFLALNEVYQVRLSDPILLHSMMLEVLLLVKFVLCDL
jgi:hypothetical protein